LTAGGHTGLMAAYAEGLNILKKADSGLRPQDADAETSRKQFGDQDEKPVGPAAR
jgi:6-phosphogluconate dehydrogenase (decarboxylating)